MTSSVSDWAARRSSTLSAVVKISLMMTHPNACHATTSWCVVVASSSDDGDDDEEWVKVDPSPGPVAARASAGEEGARMRGIAHLTNEALHCSRVARARHTSPLWMVTPANCARCSRE